MKVLIADDHWVVRETLKLVVRELRPGSECLEAATFAEARALLADNPDVELILIDLVMPGVDAFEGLATLRAEFPEMPVVVVSVHEDPDLVVRAIGHGVIGYIPKTADAAEMRHALDRILQGDVAFPRRILERAKGARGAAARPEPIESAPPAVDDRLTEREREIVMLMGTGLSVGRIAERLQLNPHTVRVHINNMRNKLGLADRAEAVHYAMRFVQARAG